MNRTLIVCGVVLTVILAAALVGFGPDNGVRTDDEISAMISQVDPAQIQIPSTPSPTPSLTSLVQTHLHRDKA